MTGNDSARADFLAALGRLRQSKPTHPDLIVMAEKGLLKISPASVAKEARRSRTLIGMEGCKYPDIRREVLASKDQSPLQIKRSQALKAMSDEVKRLKSAIQVKDTALAVARLKIAELERRLQEHEPLDPKVVPIRRSRQGS